MLVEEPFVGRDIARVQKKWLLEGPKYKEQNVDYEIDSIVKVIYLGRQI